MPFNGSSIYYVRKIFHKFNISAYICISGGSRAPDEILEMQGQKNFGCLCEWYKSEFPWKTSLAKYDFRKSGEGRKGMGKK